MEHDISVNEVAVGSQVRVLVGCRTVEATVIEVLERGWKVKSNSTGKEFAVLRVAEIIEAAPVQQVESAEVAEENVGEEDGAGAAEEAEAVPPAPPEKKLSLLDAAAQILKEAGEAMNTRSLVKQAIERRLWNPTTCKTPEQSLYGAIFREMKVAENPRFRKSLKKGSFEYAL